MLSTIEKMGKVGKMVQDYGEMKKKIYTSAYYQRMEYAQKEIDYWSKVPNAENLKKVNEFRKMYKEAEENLKRTYGEHWRKYL